MQHTTGGIITFLKCIACCYEIGNVFIIFFGVCNVVYTLYFFRKGVYICPRIRGTLLTYIVYGFEDEYPNDIRPVH